MSVPSHFCLFQAILFEHDGKPVKVLEQYYISPGRCTLQNARNMFKSRFEDSSYSRKYRAIWPDAVRFMDQSGNEILRYTAWTYLREITSLEKTQDTASPTA
jgi:hypothetical protein